MYMICRHIKTNGLRCQSPALKGAHFCYYHSKTHTVGAEPHLKFGPLQLPVPEDSASIQLSVARINDALINGRIDLKKATGLFYGIQIAAQFIDRKEHFYVDKTVQSAEQTVGGDELAPSEFIREAHDDCDDCKDCLCNDICPRCTRRDDDEDHAGESVPNAGKPKAVASEVASEIDKEKGVEKRAVKLCSTRNQ
jgi:hypothetical protein